MIDLNRGPGVDASRVLLLRLRPSLVGYGGERARRFQRNVIERLESIPGVEAAATSENLPLFMSGNDVTVRDHSSDRRLEIGGVRASHVGDGYFDVLGLSLLAGRDFNSADRVGSRPVAIADATLAAALGGNEAVGRVVTVDGQSHEIVGVVPTAQFRKALEPLVPYLYLNYWQQTGEGFAADSRTHVRVAGDSAVMLPRLRREISALDRNIPISEDYPLRDRVRFTFQPVRMAMTMLVYFGGVALVLSLVGVYGVVSSVALMRTREVALRLALGASPIQIGALMARHGLRLVIPGVVFGVVAAFYSTRALQSLLYGVALHDPATFVAVPLLLIGVALAATVGPVRRAMGVDPAVTLRNE
jgi:predicted lysophospholipase L1 biosynthesis ABC-type transport system permease subunit